MWRGGSYAYDEWGRRVRRVRRPWGSVKAKLLELRAARENPTTAELARELGCCTGYVRKTLARERKRQAA